MEIDFSFPHNYQLSIPRETPQNPPLPHYFYPRALDHGHDGVLLLVRSSQGEEWLGTFAGGWGNLSRVYSHPDPDWFLVISGSVGFVVRADDPHSWEEAPLLPVRDALAIPTEGVIVLADDTRLVGIGRGGVEWQSPTLVWDGLTISEVKGSVVRGTGDDPANEIQPIATWEYDFRSGQATTSGTPVMVNRKQEDDGIVQRFFKYFRQRR